VRAFNSVAVSIAFVCTSNGSGDGKTSETKPMVINISLMTPVLGIFEDERTIGAKITGDADPGYGSTSKMLGQVAAFLAHGGNDNKKGGSLGRAFRLLAVVLYGGQARSLNHD
jgi:hypothetical protein